MISGSRERRSPGENLRSHGWRRTGGRGARRTTCTGICCPCSCFSCSPSIRFLCYGKRLAARRLGLGAVHDRAPAMRPTPLGLANLERHAAAPRVSLRRGPTRPRLGSTASATRPPAGEASAARRKRSSSTASRPGHPFTFPNEARPSSRTCRCFGIAACAAGIGLRGIGETVPNVRMKPFKHPRLRTGPQGRATPTRGNAVFTRVSGKAAFPPELYLPTGTGKTSVVFALLAGARARGALASAPGVHRGPARDRRSGRRSASKPWVDRLAGIPEAARTIDARAAFPLAAGHRIVPIGGGEGRRRRQRRVADRSGPGRA